MSTSTKPLFLGFLLMLLSVGSGSMLGQVPANEAPSESSTRAETIDRALNDLGSNNVDTRVGSIMLLSKYQDQRALNGVAQGLRDPHVRVRRAALVSMIEIQASMPPQAVEPIIMLLGDEDAEIRRMVSSSLGMMINLWNTYNRGIQLIPVPQSMPLAIRQRFLNAFLDEDVVVRRNMLSYYFFLGIQLPETILISLLQNEDDMVRLEALRLSVRIIRFATVMKQAETLSVDPVKSIRLLFTNMLGDNRTPGAREWLELLLKDADTEVVHEAELSLFRMGPTFDSARRLTDLVLTGQFNEEQGKTFIQTLAILGERSQSLIDRLLESDNPSYRLEALRIYLGYADLRKDTKKILVLANDKSERVRSQVLNFLRSSRDRVPTQLVEGLSYARDSSVRETGLTLTRYFSNEDAEPLLFDFLIDEEARLRMMAIDELVRREASDIRETLHLSLEDSDWLIQRRAVTHLIGFNDPEELNYLKAKVEKDPKNSLSLYIKDQMLKRLGVQL
ncbi:MAG: HEAT repeat domain-containing protein [Verrucomicrobia bacterium]|nr:HEAT repeat domain-containing protein [Verrucomicrobiota bacterium]MDA1069031.1 HEAT repeat domain-containing protein [Verrucomicrobiota bacterium]